MQSFAQLNKDFDFDWNNYRTFDKKEQIENLTKSIKLALSSFKSPDTEEQKALGELCYKLGTFYCHIIRDPKIALKWLQSAQGLLTSSKKQSWITNHIAFCYQQQLSAANISGQESKEADDYQDKAMKCCEIVIEANEKETDIESIKMLAFSFCVKALTTEEMYELKEGRLELAEQYFKMALDLYEKHRLHKDGSQYARAKNRYAQILAQQGKYQDAARIFRELYEYWSKQATLSPYAAIFYAAYAEYLEKRGKTPKASQQYNALMLAASCYKIAYDIFKETEPDGENATLSKEMYKKSEELQKFLPAFTLPDTTPPYSETTAFRKFQPAPQPKKDLLKTPLEKSNASDDRQATATLR